MASLTALTARTNTSGSTLVYHETGDSPGIVVMTAEKRK
jgi:hypothetical protein